MSKSFSRFGLMGVVVLAITLPMAPAFAQSGERGCTLEKEPGGLIRGDRVPRGCVLRSEPEAAERAAEMIAGGIVVFPGVPIFFTPHPTFVVLDNLFLRRARVKPGAPTPIPLRTGHFGPLFRHFGPLERHFGPIERHFDSSTLDRSPDAPKHSVSHPEPRAGDRGD